MIIKKELKYRFKYLTPYIGGKIEIQCINIKLKNSEIDIMNVYTPPNPQFSKEEFIHYLNQLNKNFVICGDLNSHHRAWEPNLKQRVNRNGNTLKQILDEHPNIILATPPDLPTYMHVYIGKTACIDLCLCCPTLLPKLSVNTQADMGSDHLPVLVKMQISPEKVARGRRKKWKTKNANATTWTAWQTNVNNFPPQVYDPLEDRYKHLKESILTPSAEIFKKSSDKIETKHNYPWWNEECSRVTALRKRARRRVEKSRNKTSRQDNIREYRRINALAIKTLMDTQKSFWANYTGKITARSPPKEIWDMTKK